VPSYDVDGMDVLAVHAVAEEAAERARSGNGPSLVVAETYRFAGHVVGDTEIYREASEVDAWRAKDPIKLLISRLLGENLLDEEGLAGINQAARHAVDEAEHEARSSPLPSVDLAFTDVYAPAEGNDEG
jgi:pyruvate dehydrogenase E1 component alpha subunit